MAETITGKAVTIDNPEQASTNFYWTYDTVNGAFNLQTTIRGILTLEQIQAHIKSALEATAHVVSLGGLAKQVGKSETPGAKLPEPTPVDKIMTEMANTSMPWNPQEGVTVTEPVLVPVAPVVPSAPAQNTTEFMTVKLICTITNNKKYYKVTGGNWTKYGVTVWDEVLVGAGIPVGKLEGNPEGYNLNGYKATCLMKPDGKPEKIIKLEKV